MKLLIAEDDPVNLMLLQGILAPLHHQVVVANNGREALDAIRDQQFDLFLFDVMMPDADGLELTRFCRQDPRHRDVPILLLTALSSSADLAKGFEAGATDYVSKPFHATELLYRVKAHLQLRNLQILMESTMDKLNLQILEVDRQQRELEKKERELSDANTLLAEANKTLSELASKDTLTGLFNRRKGWDYMRYEEERSKRSKKPIGVAIMDLDKFKSINDTMGHETGDSVLKISSECLASTLRSADILIRWGGEEFLVIFPETEATGLARVTEKIRQAVESYPWNLQSNRKVTVSIGATVKGPDDDWQKTIDIADKALYEAKEAGRNRVVVTIPTPSVSD